MLDAALKAAATGILGAVLGWQGQALTMGPRMDAVERALLRIESRLDNINRVKGAP